MTSTKLAKSSTRKAENASIGVFRSAAINLAKRKLDEKENDKLNRSSLAASFKPLAVSSPDDPEEKEADDTADKVLRMPSSIALNKEKPKSQRTDSEEEVRISTGQQSTKLSRKAQGSPNMLGNVQADINKAKSSGAPLPLSVKRFMEPRFGADFSNIKIHTDSQSAKLNKRLSARAFAFSNHVFFGENQFKPESQEGKRLIAHELTHSIQQGAAPQKAESGTQHQSAREASSSVSKMSRDSKARTPISLKATRSASTQSINRVSSRVKHTTQATVQRLGVRDALNYFADHAHFIPGFRMFTIMLGVNPINMSRVERSPANILRAIVEFLPGGAIITSVLSRYGVFEQAGAWITEQLNGLAITGNAIEQAVLAFLDGLSWTDIFDLSGVWRRAKRIFTEPINRIINFARSAFNRILTMIKDAILVPLAQWASRTRGWDLLIAVIGRNPITGEIVERSPETLIGGFMKLIGQQEVWENIKRANAIPRAWAWFQGALAGLMGFVRSIPQLIRQVFASLQVTDLLSIPNVFARIIGTFANFALSFVRWAGAQVMGLLKIIFAVVAPGLMPYLLRAQSAFSTIISHPVRFVRNLISAGLMGFRRFASRFLTHLRASFISWLTGSLSGTNVYIPTSFSLKEIVKFVLSVLGVTWQNIRLKLVRAVGEPAVAAMERGFQIVKTLVTEGPAALWEQLKTSLASLRDMVIEKIMNFVLVSVVQAAVMRIVSMLNPAGAFVQAIVAIYNTIMFFVERMRTMLQVVRSFVGSIVNIAEGKLRPAAARVETSMAGLLTLAISFLARLMGLGNIARPIQNILTRIRRPIDSALNRAINWVVTQARRVGGFILQVGVPRDPAERLRSGLQAAKMIVKRLPRNGLGRAIIVQALAALKVRYGFRELEPRIVAGSWWVFGRINPSTGVDTETPSENASPQQSISNMPDSVDILDNNDAVQVRNYSRENRSGDFMPAMTRGGAVTLSKVGFQQEGRYVKQAVGTQQQVRYSIGEANSLYTPPPRLVGIVDSSNPEEASTYDGHRSAFGRENRRWWRELDSTSPNITWLINKGWLLPGSKKGLQSGARKWRFIYDLFNDSEKASYGNKAKNKASMLATFDQQPNDFRVNHFYQVWNTRIGEQTEIHHLLPLDFGGTNQQVFIPLSRDMHTKDANSIHLAFWNPMKRWLLDLRRVSAA